MSIRDDRMLVERLQKNYWYLWGGYTASVFGTYLSLIVVNLFIYAATGSPFLVGVFLLFRLIPAFFMGNIAGVFADRYNRKILIIIADIVRAALLISMIFLRESLFPLFIIIFIVAVCDRLYQSALGGSLPNIAGEGRILAANSYLASGRTVGLVAGPLAGGALMSFNAYDTAFAIDAATYLFSAVMVCLIRGNFQDRRPSRRKTRLWAGMKEGYSFIFARAGLLGVILIRALDAFGSSALNVGTPIFAGGFTTVSPGICYGMMYAFFGCGELAGSLIVSRMRFVVRRPPEIVVGYTIMLMALFFGVALSTKSLPVVMAGMMLSGLFEGITVVTYNIFLQKNPDDIRGRIVGTSETSVWTAMGIGMFLSGLLAEKLPIGLVVQIFASIVVVGSIIHISAWKRHLQATVEKIPCEEGANP